MNQSLDRRRRLAESRLYLVTAESPVATASGDGRPSIATIEAALAGGVDIVQLRDKSASDHDLVAAGRALRSVCDAHGALLIVNDRPDLALACGADGVHLGQDDESVEKVRRRIGGGLLIGCSTHNPAQVARAETSPADYLGVGPIHATPTKPQTEPVGIELVSFAAATTRKPFFAIGGIDRSNVGEVIAAGATGIAVVRAVCDAADPLAAAAELAGALDGRLVGGPAQ